MNSQPVFQIGQAGKKTRSVSKNAVLLGIPSPADMESPASWLTRAALSQGTSPRMLCKFLGVGIGRDIDLCMTRMAIRTIASKCGIEPYAFDFGRHMFTGLMSIDREGHSFLLFGKAGPRYRYCPVCLQEQSIKHFPVHWRFKAWRYCPLHHCLMEDRCRSCGMTVQLPAHLMQAGPNKHGIAFLHQCLGCGQPLGSHWTKVEGILTRGVLSLEEERSLSQGRAVLAAIYHRRFSYVGLSKQYRIKALVGLANMGVIPHDMFLLAPKELEQRCVQQFFSG
jgi:hypothetical protein